VTYHVRLPDANGLQNGSPVRLAGVQVGTVTSVDFSEDASLRTIDVRLAIDQAHQHRIRQDSVAAVKILTLLGGEKYIELSPGDPTVDVLPPDSFIKVPETFGMAQLEELSAGLAGDLTSISTNVRVILEAIQRQEGVVGRMLLDPNFGQQVFADIGTSARLTRETMESIHAGEGLAGRILRDERLARDTLDSISGSLDRIEALLERVSAEDGVVARALDPNGGVSRAIDNVYQASADLKDFTADLKEGRGTIGTLISDREYSEELLGNIKRMSEDLAGIAEKLNRGDGTLGQLINDPQLHEDLKHIIRGVQNSKLMSWMIRHYREEGEEAEEKARKKGQTAIPLKEPETAPQQRKPSDPSGSGPAAPHDADGDAAGSDPGESGEPATAGGGS
jgi:phospholipid/cholesterol/gamma-HCH transport system substrate-binding protein